MTSLLDVNVLIAVAWPNHVHHQNARRWFLVERDDYWATCPLTQSAFIRISSNPAIIEGAVVPSVALEMLGRYLSRGDHRFIADTVDWAAIKTPPLPIFQGHRQVTDAYLVELARANDAQLVTLDRRLVQAVQSTDYGASVLLI